MKTDLIAAVLLYAVALAASVSVGIEYGGAFWIPSVLLGIPGVIIGAGLVYGLVSGTGGVNSIDDAVSKGLEYRDDYDPEEEYDHD